MPIYKVHKTKDYTILTNHHFKNKALSLKAVGLLSLMLSLPDTWDFTEEGLTYLHTDGRDSIRAAIKELERNKYLYRTRARNKGGSLGKAIYHVFESPDQYDEFIKSLGSNFKNDKDVENKENDSKLEKDNDLPVLENPTLVKPTLSEPTLEKSIQSNTNISSTNINKYPVNLSKEEMDEISDEIKSKISYFALCSDYGTETVKGIFLTVLELSFLARSDQFVRVGDTVYHPALIKAKLNELNMFHIQYIIESLKNTKSKVKNMKNYMIKTILNSTDTIDAHYQNKVNTSFRREK